MTVGFSQVDGTLNAETTYKPEYLPGFSSEVLVYPPVDAAKLSLTFSDYYGSNRGVQGLKVFGIRQGTHRNL